MTKRCFQLLKLMQYIAAVTLYTGLWVENFRAETFGWTSTYIYSNPSRNLWKV